MKATLRLVFGLFLAVTATAQIVPGGMYVRGPATATDNALVRFDGTTGRLAQNSAVTVADTTGAMTWASGQTVTLKAGAATDAFVFGAGASEWARFAASSGNLLVNTTTDNPLEHGGTYKLLAVNGGSGYAVYNLVSSATADTSLLGGINYGTTGAVTGHRTAIGINVILNGSAADPLRASGHLQVYTRTSNTDNLTEKFRFTAPGNLLVGTTSDGANLSGGVIINGSGSGATASSTTTGALRVAAGGFSVASGDAYIGGTITASGTIIESVDTRSGAGAISVTKTTTKLTTTAADALTLADGTEGQIKRIVMVSDGGDGTLTPTTKTGYASITFNDVADSLTLQFYATVGWMIVGNYGCTVNP